MVWVGPTGSGLDGTYRAALAAGPVAVYSRLDVVDPLKGVVLRDVSFNAATVSATLQNRVTRTLSMTLDGSLYPAILSGGGIDSSAPFAPYGNRVALYRGILYGDGSSCYFPVFYGRIYTISLTHRGVFSLAASDLAKDVVDARFESPLSSTAATTSGGATSGYDQFVSLISAPGVIPGGAVFGTSDAAHAAVPALTWQEDRAQALDDMAAADGMIWYALADGSFVRRRPQWTTAGRVPQLYLSDGGVDPYATTVQLGTMASWTHTVSGDPNAGQGVNNSVVYVSERADGTSPVGAIVRDTAPGSPTNVKSKFGLRPRSARNSAAQAQQQVLAAATTMLQSAKSAQVAVTPVQAPVDGSVELGDLYQVTQRGVTSLQVVSGFTLPLRENQFMTLTFRSYASAS